MRLVFLLLAVVIVASGCSGAPVEVPEENVTQNASDFIIPEEKQEENVTQKLADCAKQNTFLKFQKCAADVANETVTTMLAGVSFPATIRVF